MYLCIKRGIGFPMEMRNILKNAVSRHPLTFIFNFFPYYESRDVSTTCILQNIFCVNQKKLTQIGLKPHEEECKWR